MSCWGGGDDCLGRGTTLLAAHARPSPACPTPRRPPPPPDATHALDSKKGLLSFFAASGAPTDFVSENGLAEAVRFHEGVRPYEGHVRRGPAPSATNRCGAPFTG